MKVRFTQLISTCFIVISLSGELPIVDWAPNLELLHPLRTPEINFNVGQYHFRVSEISVNEPFILFSKTF